VPFCAFSKKKTRPLGGERWLHSLASNDLRKDPEMSGLAAPWLMAGCLHPTVELILREHAGFDPSKVPQCILPCFSAPEICVGIAEVSGLSGAR